MGLPQLTCHCAREVVFPDNPDQRKCGGDCPGFFGQYQCGGDMEAAVFQLSPSGEKVEHPKSYTKIPPSKVCACSVEKSFSPRAEVLKS